MRNYIALFLMWFCLGARADEPTTETAQVFLFEQLKVVEVPVKELKMLYETKQIAEMQPTNKDYEVVKVSYAEPKCTVEYSIYFSPYYKQYFVAVEKSQKQYLYYKIDLNQSKALSQLLAQSPQESL